MKINFILKETELPENTDRKVFRGNARNVIKHIALEENKLLSFVNIVFCNDEIIKEYNNKFLKHDYETDIITFHDKDEEGRTEGELLISLDTVKSNSLRFKTYFEHELLRVIIHGVLHLCGYDDKTEKQKKDMRKKENVYLKLIKTENNKI